MGLVFSLLQYLSCRHYSLEDTSPGNQVWPFWHSPKETQSICSRLLKPGKFADATPPLTTGNDSFLANGNALVDQLHRLIKVSLLEVSRCESRCTCIANRNEPRCTKHSCNYFKVKSDGTFLQIWSKIALLCQENKTKWFNRNLRYLVSCHNLVACSRSTVSSFNFTPAKCSTQQCTSNCQTYPIAVHQVWEHSCHLGRCSCSQWSPQAQADALHMHHQSPAATSEGKRGENSSLVKWYWHKVLITRKTMATSI